MGIEENKALYRRFIDEVFNHGRLDLLEEFLDPAYVNHDAPPNSPQGSEGVAQIVTMFRAAFPNLSITIEKQVGEGDLVCNLATTRGVQKGPLFGMPATGKMMIMTGMTMVRVVNGRIAESWVKNDMLDLMRQIEAEQKAA
jgi:predicted ester cyclase